MTDRDPEEEARDEPAAPGSPAVAAVPVRFFLRYFLGLGTWGFGGPIASVGYMHG